MKELVNFEHFKIIKEAEAKLESYLDSLMEQAINEAPAQTQAGALFQNPVKFMKIKNNAKKYQQALVQKALNNVDYEKKKQAAGGEVDKDKMEVLKQANAAKNQALSDKASAISDRMTQLATSPGLQAVKSLAVSKAKVAAAETALKAADAEESKQLKVQIAKLNAQAAKAEKTIKDYEKQEEPKAETPAEAPQQAMPNVKAETKPEAKPEAKPETDTQPTAEPATTKKTRRQEVEDQIAQDNAAPAKITKESPAEKKERERKETITNKINDAEAAIQKAEGDKTVAQQEKDDLVKQLNAAKGTDKENALAVDVANADRAVKDIDKGISNLKQNIKDLRSQLKGDSNESAGYIGESFTDKFRRLMKDVNV